jgi:forkhead box protein J2/3
MDVPMDQQAQNSGLPANLIPPDTSGESVNNYYPPELNDGSNGLPISLDSLRDGPPGSKPFYPYSTLIRYGVCICWFVLVT